MDDNIISNNDISMSDNGISFSDVFIVIPGRGIIHSEYIGIISY